jgi:hypothetical protein
MAELCRICHTRRPRRYCSGIEGDICSPCCGDQREVNISCPLDCQYLQEARLHERPLELDRATVPNKDIAIGEDFIAKHEELALFCLYTLADAAMRTPGAVDADILKAVEAVIRTHRTAESGLVYETRAEDQVAAAVQDYFERALADFQKQRSENEGLSPLRSAEILGCLVFAQRYALMQQNGRPRGRAFIDFVRHRLKIPKPQNMGGLLVS